MIETTLARRSERGRLNRQLVMETAMGLFSSQGYDRTSMNDIAAALGITKAALYYHFPGKEDILVAGVDQASDMAGAALTRAVCGSEDASAPQRLKKFVQAYGLALGDPIFRCLVLADVRALGPKAKSAILDCKKRHQRQLEGLLREAMIPPADVRPMALALFGAFNWTASAFQQDVGPEIDGLVRIVSQAIDHAIHAPGADHALFDRI